MPVKMPVTKNPNEVIGDEYIEGSILTTVEVIQQVSVKSINFMPDQPEHVLAVVRKQFFDPGTGEKLYDEVDSDYLLKSEIKEKLNLDIKRMIASEEMKKKA